MADAVGEANLNFGDRLNFTAVSTSIQVEDAVRLTTLIMNGYEQDVLLMWMAGCPHGLLTRYLGLTTYHYDLPLQHLDGEES